MLLLLLQLLAAAAALPWLLLPLLPTAVQRQLVPGLQVHRSCWQCLAGAGVGGSAYGHQPQPLPLLLMPPLLLPPTQLPPLMLLLCARAALPRVRRLCWQLAAAGAAPAGAAAGMAGPCRARARR
jgi:hypothetical protein